VGESREGGGRTAGPTVTKVLRLVAKDQENDDGRLDSIQILRCNDDLWAVNITRLGDAKPERYFLSVANGRQD
jgi:hypothetical protein